MGRPSGPSRHAYGPIGNPGCPIGNPVGLIARWRAAQVRPAPRQSAPGAIVGQVCALGAASGSFSALGASLSYFQCAWRQLELLSLRLAPFRIDTKCRYFCALSASILIIKSFNFQLHSAFIRFKVTFGRRFGPSRSVVRHAPAMVTTVLCLPSVPLLSR